MLFRMISLIVFIPGLWAVLYYFYEEQPRSIADPLCQLQVHIRDQQTGQSVPARVYLVDSAGKHWDPDGAITIDWIDREIEFYKKEASFKQPEHRAEILSFFQKARGVYSKLTEN
jgi:hypothetical protein